MKRWILPTLIMALLLWFISVPAEGLGGVGFWAVRREGTFLTGFIAYLMMAGAMVLALRLPWMEQRIGGLDRSYQLHKWLGIGSAALVFVHWMFEVAPKWMVQAGWIAPPVRGPRGVGVEPFFGAFTGPAKDVGEILAYILIALVIVALIKLVPYHWFRRLHKVFPVVFLVGTFHGVVLMPDAMWPTAVGVLTGIAAVAGTIASVMVLFNRVGKGRTHPGTISKVERLDGQTLEIECTLEGRGMKHRAGQFAFVDIEGLRDPHPFTIASAGTDPSFMRFIVKQLGDDTARMMQTLRDGTRVQVEGPYGAFNFRDTADGQIWVGAGIGVTPFVAQLEKLAQEGTPPKKPIHFFYCAPANSPLAERIRALCQKARVTLHWIDYERDGSLTMDRIAHATGNTSRASVWFCGPRPFGDMLEKGWAAIGGKSRLFHREMFAMR